MITVLTELAIPKCQRALATCIFTILYDMIFKVVVWRFIARRVTNR